MVRVRQILLSKSKQTILITGHRGFVGRHLLTHVVGKAYDDAKPTEILGIDLQDGGEDIRTAYLPDADRVYHLAAVTDAQSDDTKLIYQVNLRASVGLFKKYRDRLVFASSSMAAYRESSPYAESKYLAEKNAIEHGCAVVRFCNLFGPGGHSVIDKFRDGREIVIRGTGDQVRTYAHVGHAVRALVAARPGETKILEGTTQTVNQIADMYKWNKPVRREPAHPLDLMDGRQVFSNPVSPVETFPSGS